MGKASHFSIFSPLFIEQIGRVGGAVFGITFGLAILSSPTFAQYAPSAQNAQQRVYGAAQTVVDGTRAGSQYAAQAPAYGTYGAYAAPNAGVGNRQAQNYPQQEEANVSAGQ
ncbi:MAG: hypothetical protein HUK22_02330, partial [Thermoguttaceae bacterium]|nr:hypothetical protein [Thermoguttaceae bacterium]